MIIFHQGLPGSGKSYAAMVDHIIPALKKGRKVFAYIEGLDVEKIAAASDLTVERVQELLHTLVRDDVPLVYQKVQNDSLVVLDEAQNFWPDRRVPLNSEITQFVTEHRHRGLDVLLMGQVLGDVHKLWRGRVDTLIVFRKRDAVGKANEYSWSVQKQDSRQRFKEVNKGKRPYDSKYFGTYASHTSDTENVDTYSDDRANVKNSKIYKGLKYFAVAVVLALAFLVWLFRSGSMVGEVKKPAGGPVPRPVPVEMQKQLSVAGVSGAVAPQATSSAVLADARQAGAVGDAKVDDYVVQLTEKNRIRLTGVIRGRSGMAGSVEWRDASNRLVDRMTFEDLHGFGWYVMVATTGNVATLSRPGKTFVVTAWPLNDEREVMPAKVPDTTVERLREISAPDPVKVAAVEGVK